MNKISKIVVLLSAVPILAFGAAADQPAATNNASKLDSLFGDSVVVKGKGIEIKRNQLDNEVVNARAAYATHNMPAPPDLEQQALRQLVIDQLILSKATDADRAKSKEEFNTQLASAKTENHWSDEDLDKRINAQLIAGQTRQQWEQERIDKLVVARVLQREMGINITDEDVKNFYNDPANTPAFEQPEMVRASHILLMTSDPATHQPLSAEQKAAKRKEMEDILKQAKDGKDFAELAKKYSEDPGSKETGGEYTFPRGQMVKQFEDTAFSLKPGEISEIIETQFGYHIIKLSEKIPAKKVDFEKVKAQIKDHLLEAAIRKQFRTYMAKLEKDSNLEIVDDNLKGTDLLPPELPAAGAAAPPPATQK